MMTCIKLYAVQFVIMILCLNVQLYNRCNRAHASRLVCALRFVFVKYAYTCSYQCATENKYFMWPNVYLAILK